MPITPYGARAHDARDATALRVPTPLDRADDGAALTIAQIAERVPAAYRQAYLDGAANAQGVPVGS
jgi:hypothetical protein